MYLNVLGATMADVNSIPLKISRLNQMLQGKEKDFEHKSLLCRDGLIDSLIVLHEECTHKSLMKNQYVSNFVNKCKTLPLNYTH